MEPIAYIIQLFYSLVAYTYFLITRGGVFDLGPFKAYWSQRLKVGGCLAPQLAEEGIGHGWGRDWLRVQAYVMCLVCTSFVCTQLCTDIVVIGGAAWLCKVYMRAHATVHDDVAAVKTATACCPYPLQTSLHP